MSGAHKELGEGKRLYIPMNWFMPLEWSYPGILVRRFAGSR